MECIEFPGLCHLVILAESGSSVRHIQALDSLRGLITTLGIEFSEPHKLMKAVRRHSAELLPQDIEIPLSIVRIPARTHDIKCITSKTCTVLRLKPGSSERIEIMSKNSSERIANFPGPEFSHAFDDVEPAVLLFMSSNDATLLDDFERMMMKASGELSTVDAVESIRGELEGRSDEKSGISLVWIKRASSKSIYETEKI